MARKIYITPSSIETLSIQSGRKKLAGSRQAPTRVKHITTEAIGLAAYRKISTFRSGDDSMAEPISSCRLEVDDEMDIRISAEELLPELESYVQVLKEVKAGRHTINFHSKTRIQELSVMCRKINEAIRSMHILPRSPAGIQHGDQHMELEVNKQKQTMEDDMDLGESAQELTMEEVMAAEEEDFASYRSDWESRWGSKGGCGFFKGTSELTCMHYHSILFS